MAITTVQLPGCGPDGQPDGSSIDVITKDAFLKYFSCDDDGNLIPVFNINCEDVAACVPAEAVLVINTDGTPNGVAQSGQADHIVDITILGDVAGNLLSTSPNGGVGVTCEDILACITPETPLVVTTNGTATGVAQSGTNDHVVDITVTSTDATNIASVGPDGGTLVTCEDVNACVVETDLVVTTDGTTTGVGQSGTADHVLDITLLSGASGNILTTEVDGGLYLDCAAVTACVMDDLDEQTLSTNNATGELTISNGNTVSLCEIVESCQTDITVLVNGSNTGVTLGGDSDHDIEITTLGDSTGNLIRIDANGGLVLECADIAECAVGNTSVVTQTVTTGNEIASHDDGDGNTVAVIETCTPITVVDPCTKSYTDECGVQMDIINQEDVPDMVFEHSGDVNLGTITLGPLAGEQSFGIVTVSVTNPSACDDYAWEVDFLIPEARQSVTDEINPDGSDTANNSYSPMHRLFISEDGAAPVQHFVGFQRTFSMATVQSNQNVFNDVIGIGAESPLHAYNAMGTIAPGVTKTFAFDTTCINVLNDYETLYGSFVRASIKAWRI